MKRTVIKGIAFICLLSMLASFTACGNAATESSSSESASESIQETSSESHSEEYSGSHLIVLGGNSASIDGNEIETSDYTWHVDPASVHNDVKDAPAEYYTGTKPETDAAAYIDHELYYFPALSQDGFKLVNYDGEREYAYYYTDGVNEDYIFATLPVLGNSFPTSMMHTEEEAAENSVLHITKAGTYVLEGSWNGQIWIDLGDTDNTFADENAKVTLVLNGADINCSVAPGIVFYSVYECDNAWESRESSTMDIDLSEAGAKIIIADGSENSVSGCNIFRMLKTKYKNEEDVSEVKVQKKMRKTDGALYSYVSLVIDSEEEGNGKLSINSSFEGLDSELHLAINGGEVTINSQDDGINVNEDDVSVVFFNGGKLTINAAQGAEGDGVDSNGYIVINGGETAVNNVRTPDSSFDSELGVYYYGGTVIIDGTEMSLSEGSQGHEISGSGQGMGGAGGPGGGFPGGQPDQGGFPGGAEFPSGQPDQGGFPGGQDFDIQEFKKKVAELGDDATLEDVLEILGINGFGGGPGFGGDSGFSGSDGQNGGEPGNPGSEQRP